MEIDIDALKQSMGCEVIPISLKETLDFLALSQTIEDFNPTTHTINKNNACGNIKKVN
jgi:ferrous iron transport protein B